jgi:hypothetical protein
MDHIGRREATNIAHLTTDKAPRILRVDMVVHKARDSISNHMFSQIEDKSNIAHQRIPHLRR